MHNIRDIARYLYGKGKVKGLWDVSPDAGELCTLKVNALMEYLTRYTREYQSNLSGYLPHPQNYIAPDAHYIK